MDLTLTVPDELATRLRPWRPGCPEILELGLREWLSSSPGYAGLGDVLETLARLPSSEEVLGLRPATHLQDRIEELLATTVPGACRPRNRGNGNATSTSSTSSVWPRSGPSGVRRSGERSSERDARSASLRRLVRERAGECCEYCLIPEAMTWALATINHIIARKAWLAL